MSEFLSKFKSRKNIATPAVPTDAKPATGIVLTATQRAEMKASAARTMRDLQVSTAGTIAETVAKNSGDATTTHDVTPTNRRKRTGVLTALSVVPVGIALLAGCAHPTVGSNNDEKGGGKSIGDLFPSQSAGTDTEKNNSNKEWPKTAAEAAKQMGLESADAKYIVKGDNGVWMAEFFPLQDGVTFEDGEHKLDGKTITDPNKIFDFSVEPEWAEVTNESGNGILFARTGGAGGADKNISRFMGPSDKTVDMIEQAALIPPSEECVNDPDTAAWRSALVEFVYNKDAQNKVVTVEWYNPKTEALQKVDGKTIASYAKGMSDSEKADFAETLNKLPMGYPLTPEQAVKMSGGTTKPENWTFDINSGVWTFEGFKLASGVHYDSAGGVLRKGGNIVGADHAYNYTDWKGAKSSWPTKWKFPSVDGVYGFARTGGGSDYKPDSSYYGFDATVETNGKHGFEQGAIIPVNPRQDCTAEDAVDQAIDRDANRQADNLDVIEVKIFRGNDVEDVK